MKLFFCAWTGFCVCVGFGLRGLISWLKKTPKDEQEEVGITIFGAMWFGAVLGVIFASVQEKWIY